MCRYSPSHNAIMLNLNVISIMCILKTLNCLRETMKNLLLSKFCFSITFAIIRQGHITEKLERSKQKGQNFSQIVFGIMELLKETFLTMFFNMHLVAAF